MDAIQKFFDRSLDLMGQTLSLRLKRHANIAANLANMDTPNYKVKDLAFEQVLQDALPVSEGRLAMRATDPRHLPVRNVQQAYARAGKNVVEGVYGQDEKGQDVLDIDQEMTKLVKNHLLYNATIQILAKEFEKLKYAISEGGR
jgi:flagellar basal-body rod protein FlgB